MSGFHIFSLSDTFPPPPPFPHGYPTPYPDNPLLLRTFPDPWIRDRNIAYNTPPNRVLTNVSLIDETTHIIDDLDRTKRFKFQAENISPNTTREITIPDTDLTLIGKDTFDTLTNKNITGSTNTIGATQLETSGTAVQITSTAPTIAGQVLITTSATTAVWQTLGGGGGGGLISYTLANSKIASPNITYTTIAVMPWLQTRFVTYTNGIIIFNVTIGNRDLDIRLRNVTASNNVGELTGVSTSGVKTFLLTNLPTADAQLELQIKKDSTGGVSPIIDGVVVEFNI